MRVLILLSIVAAAFASQLKCGENEHFESCGTACPLTCDNHDNPPKICPMMCNIGCHCDKGFVRNSQGKCVKVLDCPPRTEQVCGENEGFESCGSACPLTCDNYDDPPEICTMQCIIGCHCKPGFVRHNNGKCVRIEECPSRTEPVCGENQRYTTCGSACPLTCDNYNKAPEACIDMCVSGCSCENGYVKNNDGRCVRPENCPRKTQVEEAPTASACLQEKVVGPCKASIPSWFFNKQSGRCERFIYGGCGGNSNNFNTEEECHNLCSVDAALTVSVCLEEKVVGPCFAAFRRWFFNKQTGRCERFIYGGCGGNNNNFNTEEECHSICAASLAPTACLAEKVTGPCRGNFPRWFFNTATGECEKFTYGGCRGNSNNFESKEDCHAVCVA